MKLQELDAYAIKSYSFALGKTNSFFSLTTVILTLLVILLSIFINISSVRHLWIPRDQLDITLSNSLLYPPPFTSTLVCYANNDLGGNVTVPAVRFWDTTGAFYSFPSVSQAEATKRFPTLAPLINQTFGCVDIAGYTFNNSNPAFYIEVQTLKATIYIQSTTVQDIIYNRPPTFLKRSLVVNQFFTQSTVAYGLLNFISANVYDSLSSNDNGASISTFDSSSYLSNGNQVTTPVLSDYAKFFLNFVEYKNARLNVSQLTITRMSIGTIIGNVLSWISILGLICGFIVSPLMDYSLTLIQSEALFHTAPKDRRPSILKYIIASFKKGWFPKEDKYVKLGEELEKLKNIGCSLKVQKTLKRLCPPNPKINQNEILAIEHNFDQPEYDDFGVELYSQSSKTSQAQFEVEQDDNNENILTKLRQALFRSLDSGSDNISVNYSGSGYGSKESFCVSLLFIAGFLGFLVLFGVFKFSTVTTTYAVISDQPLSYTLIPNEFVITTSPNLTVSGMIVDGYHNIISNVSFTTDPSCRRYVTTAFLTRNSMTGTGDTIYCFTDSVTITYSPVKSQVRMFYLDVPTLNNGFNAGHFQTDPTYSSIVDRFTFGASGALVQGKHFTATFQVINSNQDSNPVSETVQLNNGSYSANLESSLPGFFFSLSPIQTNIDTNTSTIFDVVQNIWGFATICFTVILLKLAKYINLRQKQKIVTPEKAEYRDSLCIYLSKLNGLLAGRHKGELEKAKYYIKQPMPSQ